MKIDNLKKLDLISEKIFQKVSKSDCIFLFGEIGVGKTTFVRSLIQHIQRKKKLHQTDVLSPTFNLVYEYDLEDLKIMHYDLFRIENSKDIKQLGIFQNFEKTVKIIEWPELICDKISDRLEIYFEYCEKENERMITFEGFGKWKNFTLDEI